MRIKGHPLWVMFSLVSLLMGLTLAFGFVWAVKDVIQSPGDPVSQEEVREAGARKETRDKLLVSLGDSLTRGTGDREGQGYVTRVKEALQKNNEAVRAVNLAVMGQTSEGLLEQVKLKRVRRVIADARWITLTIGGNDLFRKGAALEEDTEHTQQARIAYRKNLKEILTLIRQENQTAPIFLFGLYHPFGHLKDPRAGDTVVHQWNNTLIQVAGSFDQVVVIPVFDIFQLHPKKYLASDLFHPNHTGYEFFADRLLQAMNGQSPGGVRR